jgi:hypothetical protein
MTIRPIIFSGPMVRALLDGRKSQTRRITPCPLGKTEVGDLLYVREAFTIQQSSHYSSSETGRVTNTCLDYAADGARTWFDMPTDDVKPAWKRRPDANGGPFMRPAMFFPRAASRLTLRVTRVFFDQVRRISEADASKEGVNLNKGVGPSMAVEAFSNLWDSLHTKPGETWADDPRVVAIQFETIRANVGAVKEMADG